LGTLPAVFGGRLRLNRRQLFSAGLPADEADAYLKRMTFVRPTSRKNRAIPVGDPPVLVVGSPDDRIVPRKALDRTAADYGVAPLLFPGMGHDLMLDAGWAEPLDAVLDWLTKEISAPS
jgi:pimeloyl-ACP methyl ester carboxylesterase